MRLYGLLVMLHLYVGARLLPDMAWGGVAMVATGGWLLLSLLGMPLTRKARTGRGARSDELAWAGWIAMGSFSILFMLTFLRDLSLLLFNVCRLWAEARWWHEVHEISALAVPALAALLTVAGLINARTLARVRRIDIPIANLPEALDGFIMVQISDLHIGSTIKHGYISAIVDAVNALEADLIAITGDLVDGTVKQLSEHIRPLSRLSAKHGVFVATGNHEYYSGAKGWIAEFRKLGLRVLLNEHVVLAHGGARMVVAGVTDYGSHHYDSSHRSDPAGALAGAPPGAGVKVLLAHQPRSAFAAADAGYDLQLSGHTHGGQLVPWNYFVRLQQPFTAGLHRLGRLWVYTSRGTGYWGPPIRLGAPSEITRLRLVPG